MSGANFTAELRKADIVISHAGAGSALTILDNGRYPILVPRDPQYGEIRDSHQLQMAHELEERRLALHRAATDISVEDLLDSMKKTIKRVDAPRLMLQP